jgi:hypothetical protein
LIHLAHVRERTRCDQRAVADEETICRGLLRVSRHMFVRDRKHLVPAPEVIERGEQWPGDMHPLVRNRVEGQSVAPPGELQPGLEVCFDGDCQHGCGLEGVDELLPGAGLGSGEALLREGKRITVAACDPVQDAERGVGRIDEVI